MPTDISNAAAVEKKIFRTQENRESPLKYVIASFLVAKDCVGQPLYFSMLSHRFIPELLVQLSRPWPERATFLLC